MALAVRPLPGIRFETVVPPPVSILPRMDIAAFVGFAASGPVDVPVAVDDPARFAAVFGEDAPLFWDEREGELVQGLLAPAVRSFFRNGGRRCWVVRVAAPAAGVTRFPIPGLVYRRPDGFLRPATLEARSQGSWADPLAVGAALASDGLPLRAAGPSAFLAERRAGLAPGDLLRVTYRDGGLVLLAAVSEVRTPDEQEADDDGEELVRVAVDPAVWLAAEAPEAGERGRARFLGADGKPHAATATVVEGAADAVALELEVGAALAPPPGAHVRVDLPGPLLWLRVTDVPTGTERETRVVGVPARPLRGHDRQVEPGEQPERAERLTLELRVRRGEAEVARLDGLGLAPGHPRYLGDLPTDCRLYGGEAPAPLWDEAASPRFPLAAHPVWHDVPAARQRRRDAERPPRQRRDGVYLPLAVPPLAEDFLGAWLPRGAPLHRDGLDRLSRSLFLDPGLEGVRAAQLEGEADFHRYLAERPRRLRGVHAVLALEEPTIVAVPDAVHRRWYRAAAVAAERTLSPDQPADPRGEGFADCALRLLRTPELSGSGPDAAGLVALDWTETDAAEATYVVQEAADPRFEDAVEAYRGPERRARLYGRGRRLAYYRVRAEAAGNVSRWSDGYAALAQPGAAWARIERQAGPDEELARVHAALLRVCAARGDVTALLSVPEHYRIAELRAHLELLASTRDGMLGAGEEVALGFGALYHPWLVAATPERPLDFRAQPPDGAAAGVLAARALARGAWVAPANEPLADVVALRPPLGPDALAPLQDLQVNAVRQAPEGFLWLASDTLALDPDRRALNVRRLLNLLRRAAVRNGTPYVFEPNGPALQRRVERGFGELLGRLFDLGAFAGATPEESYRVSVASDEERLVVELRVAPSLPLRFLVVRLVQRASGGLVLEEL